jgi:hypothetical protein
MGEGVAMTDSTKIKVGICLVVAECILLIMTLGFKAVMDAQAERHGIATIINQAGE